LKSAFHCLHTERELEPQLFKIHKRNRNFSKVGTGTVKNIYGSATMVKRKFGRRLNTFSNYLDYYDQCFESGSGSMWIRIEMAPLDPDPYWGMRIRIQDSQNGVQKGKQSEISS